MDLYSLMVVRTNSCTTPVERYKFDNIFRKFYGKDSSLEIRITFDIVLPFHASCSKHQSRKPHHGNC